mmetsp:Transcript_6065/g.7851  ORF Transcript_6065/g.7851 Transcript_6065/m.7851 type:complete len:332 (-) Transcript_6065:80-1075(-)
MPRKTRGTSKSTNIANITPIKEKLGKECNIDSKMSSKCSRIVSVLNELYPDPPIPLDHKDNFTLLCAVMLSAQSTDGKVNEVTKELFNVAPNPYKLANMKYETVLDIIRSVGLAPTKAKNLIKCSQLLIDEFNGEVPSSTEMLTTLPGVGPKTAAVVMAQAFGYQTFPVDTHIHRLALRWKLSKENKNPDKVSIELRKHFPEYLWNKLHLQFIYFGREHCPSKNHNSSICPICSWINHSDLEKESSSSKQQDNLKLKQILNDSITKNNTPTKHRGIIFYSERILELRKSLNEVDLKTVKNIKIEKEEDDEHKRVAVSQVVPRKRKKIKTES